MVSKTTKSAKGTIAVGDDGMLVLNAAKLGSGLGRFHDEKNRGSSVIRISKDATRLLTEIAKWPPNQRLWITITDQGIFVKPLGGDNGQP